MALDTRTEPVRTKVSFAPDSRRRRPAGPNGRPTAGKTSPEFARARVQKRRNLQAGSVACLVVSAFLVGIWAVTGAGYFWPGWVLGAWGAGMLLSLWDYGGGPVTEADVDQELRATR